MNLAEQLLSALAAYGLPILAGVVFIGCLGLPLPNGLLLIAAGSFAAAGQMNYWSVLWVGTAAAAGGDLLGYSIGRWGGHLAIQRLTRLRDRLLKAENKVRRHGGWGIFITRWLITPLGPWVNLLSGASEYPWPRFLLWDVAGEALWVVLYVSLGHVIAGQVQSISAVAGDITWIAVAVAAAVIIGWLLVRKRARSRRPAPVSRAD